VTLRAPAKKESSVTLTIPAASGSDRSSERSPSSQLSALLTAADAIPGYGSAAHAAPIALSPHPGRLTMALRCVYTDLDGTLLGQGGSLFADYEGNFSRKQALALEACARAGVEIVIKSGRREAQVMEDARLISQSAYIYEAGCGVMIDGERTLLTGELVPDDDGTVAQKLAAAGIPDLLFEHFEGRLEYHSPWHHDRQLSLLFRGKVDVDEANALLREHGHENLRFLDNGAINRTMPGIEVAHAYHLVPQGASKARAVAIHMRARGFDPDNCIAIGDSVEDLAVAPEVARFFVPANGPERDPTMTAAIARHPNVTVTEGRAGDGFYEAVVETLATGA
jgi:hydroxymethylpyrimidine pyrophosphatase-like HAD family hydrolase